MPLCISQCVEVHAATFVPVHAASLVAMHAAMLLGMQRRLWQRMQRCCWTCSAACGNACSDAVGHAAPLVATHAAMLLGMQRCLWQYMQRCCWACSQADGISCSHAVGHAYGKLCGSDKDETGRTSVPYHGIKLLAVLPLLFASRVGISPEATPLLTSRVEIMPQATLVLRSVLEYCLRPHPFFAKRVKVVAMAILLFQPSLGPRVLSGRAGCHFERLLAMGCGRSTASISACEVEGSARIPGPPSLEASVPWGSGAAPQATALERWRDQPGSQHLHCSKHLRHGVPEQHQHVGARAVGNGDLTSPLLRASKLHG
eukprot:365854-Chlamydomonas_euryale.AAC.5